MPQSFEDRSSARGQGPTRAPSSFAKVAPSGGPSVGGTANLRAHAKVLTAAKTPVVRPAPEGPPPGVQRFEDGRC